MESNSPSAPKPDQDAPAVFPLKGEIDLHVFPEITASLDAVIEKKPRHIVVDVSGVTYIDSAGLAALILAMQKVEAYGGRFSLAGVQTTVRSIFKISRLDDVFEIFPDADAALTYQASDNSTRTRERLSFTVRSTV
jgi:anti-sigma B factor antagonist